MKFEGKYAKSNGIVLLYIYLYEIFVLEKPTMQRMGSNFEFHAHEITNTFIYKANLFQFRI